MKLLDKVRVRIRLKGYSIRTEKSYVSWIRRFILLHGKRHPNEIGKPEIEAFLSHLIMRSNLCPRRQPLSLILALPGQEGKKDRITMIYTHVINRGGRGVISPKDMMYSISRSVMGPGGLP